MYIFKLTCDNHNPVKPPLRKNKINENTNQNGIVGNKQPLTIVSSQFTTFITAGNDIIIVIVLNNDLAL
jgi:hypothetical protein